MPQFHPYNVIDGYRSPRWVDPTPLAIIVRALFFFSWFFGSFQSLAFPSKPLVDYRTPSLAQRDPLGICHGHSHSLSNNRSAMVLPESESSISRYTLSISE